MGFVGQIWNFIFTPLKFAISAVLVGFHWLFSLVMDPNWGVTWILSIIGLTIAIRAALVPLFVKQIKSSRNMQLLQPRVRELQKKYGHDREKLAQETMALYRETGTNPFAACLPLLIQMPIFFALFNVLDNAAKHGVGVGPLSNAAARNFAESSFLGIHTSSTLAKFSSHGLVFSQSTAVVIFAATLVVVMTTTTFLTQRQLMSKNMPAEAMQGQFAQQQKIMLYFLPIIFAFSGVTFPIGVMLYWTTSNFWTMGQQFYVIRNNPSPGTPAFEAKKKRDAAKGIVHELVDGVVPVNEHATHTPPPTSEPRQQPKKQTREQRKKKA